MINLEYHYVIIFTILGLNLTGVFLFIIGLVISNISCRKIGTLLMLFAGFVSPISSFAVGQIRLNEVYKSDLSKLGNFQLIQLQEHFFQHTVLSHQAASINIILGCMAFFALWARTKHFGLSIMIVLFACLSIIFQYVTFESLQALAKYSL